MRTKNDSTYQEHKEGILTGFNLWKNDPSYWTPEHVTNYILDEEIECSDTGFIPSTSEFLIIMAIGQFELKEDILEERIANVLGYHIYRYENMGRYKSDLAEDEIAEVEKDIAYIKSKIRLPELYSYEDREWEKSNG